MEGTSNVEHDRWMAKITHALRSFRTASLLKAEQVPTRQRSDGAADGQERDR
jgi:hypothetical protein